MTGIGYNKYNGTAQAVVQVSPCALLVPLSMPRGGGSICFKVCVLVLVIVLDARPLH